MKAEVDELDNKLMFQLYKLNNSKTKVDDLDIGKLKTVPLDLKKLSDVVGKEGVKNTNFETLNIKQIIWKRKLLMGPL